jgi:D-glycero-alpha-D-manno-heptose-7-phosphate kinase
MSFSDEGYVVTPLVFPRGRKVLLEKRLMLFFTGFTRFSAHIQEGMNDKLKNKVEQLLEMTALVEAASDLLQSQHACLDDFGELLDYTWKLKRDTNSAVSTTSIDNLYQRALNAGALGGKLLGAGGGGFLLFYATEDCQKSVENALPELLRIPFAFEDEGVKTIYSNLESEIETERRSGSV